MFGIVRSRCHRLADAERDSAGQTWQTGNGMNPNVVNQRVKTSNTTTMPPTVGIWRLTGTLHRGKWCDLYGAQPADATGSPRSDYVVKIVRRSTQEDPEAARQIRTEAAAGTSARQPHLVTILDGQLDGARPYIVMPRIEAVTLTSVMASANPLFPQPLPVVLWWLRQCAQGLVALHSAGWVHGDIKPDNILLDTRGHVTVIDLGLAQRIGTLSPTQFSGTPDYSAPERLACQSPWQPSSDIYALGVVLDRLLTSQSKIPTSLLQWKNRALSEDPAARPTAVSSVDSLLKLEIETLHLHIQPRDLFDRRVA